MHIADLELTIRKSPISNYNADIRFTSAEGSISSDFAVNVPICFDTSALLATFLNAEEYGRQLSAMLFADAALRRAWEKARDQARGANSDLRVRLRLDPTDADLHALRWETLRDPANDQPLATDGHVLLSRYMSIGDTQPLKPPQRAQIKALVVIANPNDLCEHGLASLDVAAEVTRIRAALGPITCVVLANIDKARPATLRVLLQHLRQGYDMVYLVCHGVRQGEKSYLWLENEDGRSDRVSSVEFVRAIRELPQQPLLMVLAACQSAGAPHDPTILQMVGPQLAQAGIGAVVAMQGQVPTAAVAHMLPDFFHALRDHGQIDRALAVARSAARGHPWWLPVLFMRVADGRLWQPTKRAFTTQTAGWVGVVILLALVLAGVGGLVYNTFFAPPPPMPDGWNIAVAGIGKINAQGIVIEDRSDGVAVSQQILNAIKDHADHRAGWQRDTRSNEQIYGGVGFITGSLTERTAQAADVARRTNADVVIYGFIEPRSPQRVAFTPEFYIAQEQKSDAVAGLEIIGAEQFGAPIEVTLDVDRGAGIRAVETRLAMLGYFLNGLQHYYAEDFPLAREDFCIALHNGVTPSGSCTIPATFAGSQSDNQAAAVIYLFLAALEARANPADYTATLRYNAEAHRLWPGYARPFLSRGYVFYQHALAKSEQTRSSATNSGGAIPTCFTETTLAPTTLEGYATRALACYDEALAAPDRPPNAALELKIELDRGAVHLLRAMTKPTNQASWQAALRAFERVITGYESSDSATQTRLFRVAAFAYARRALWIVCEPNCSSPRLKTPSDYAQAVADYERAISLLQQPASCAEDINRCYADDRKAIENFRAELANLKNYLTQPQSLRPLPVTYRSYVVPQAGWLKPPDPGSQAASAV